MLNPIVSRMMPAPEPNIAWLMAEVAIIAVALAFIVFALVVLLPPLLRDLHLWSRQAFGARRQSNILRFKVRLDAESETRRRQLQALVVSGQHGGRR